MDADQLKAFCGSLPGAACQLHGAPANILVYSVRGKRFAHFKTSDPEHWRFSLKAPPERFLELTDMPGVKPARWLARFHWITIVDVRQFPERDLQALVRWSHECAVAKLPRREREALASSG